MPQISNDIHVVRSIQEHLSIVYGNLTPYIHNYTHTQYNCHIIIAIIYNVHTPNNIIMRKLFYNPADILSASTIARFHFCFDSANNTGYKVHCIQAEPTHTPRRFIGTLTLLSIIYYYRWSSTQCNVPHRNIHTRGPNFSVCNYTEMWLL